MHELYFNCNFCKCDFKHDILNYSPSILLITSREHETFTICQQCEVDIIITRFKTYLATSIDAPKIRKYMSLEHIYLSDILPEYFNI